VSLYSQTIFPRLCDFVLGRPFVALQRQQLLRAAHGEILEIGFGTGLNLPHYPAGVSKITTVEPNAGMNRLAMKRIKQAKIEVDQRFASGERLPFDDDCFDCVVSTFTLCSVGDARRVIDELHRVLKPGGAFLFLEHGLSPDSHVQKWQRRLTRLQMWLADGCRLDRDFKQLIATPTFSSVVEDEFYLEKTPRTHGYLYRGKAIK
jgi:ubiquinone/menaquinone biosynthesis C-methylase UbiE